jgi:hypothetical protein
VGPFCEGLILSWTDIFLKIKGLWDWVVGIQQISILFYLPGIFIWNLIWDFLDMVIVRNNG